MVFDSSNHRNGLSGHALRNAHLREHSLARAQLAPPLARTIVHIRAGTLGMTRLEFSRLSGISRGTLRDLELGVHKPTRQTLKQFVAFCQECQVSREQLEELRRLYAGPGDTLQQFIARLELQAGSPRELARRVGISPATLWEYRRGNFPLPAALLRRLCQAVGEDPERAEVLWHQAERQRLLDRGYPEALAEFWVLCVRAGYAERHLLHLGVSTAAARRLRYLELPAWKDIAGVAATLCRTESELSRLQRLWKRNTVEQGRRRGHAFGFRLKRLRKRQGSSRRELADLFGIGGKKPARIIKYIEEDGFYSAQAYPAGLAALLARGPAEHHRLVKLWQARRRQFHRRHRPETRIDLRLARELYGFGLQDMEPILGYSNLEYQRIERGVTPLRDTARDRILQAIHQTGRRRVAALLTARNARESARLAWKSPSSITALVTLLAEREGGLVPLARFLRQGKVKGISISQLRAIAQGSEVPPWPVLQQIALVCGVSSLAAVQQDWAERYRAQLQTQCSSPLGVELRLLIAEVASTVRAFSPRLSFNYSVLVRDLQKIDRDEAVRWFHIERILQGLGLPPEDERWREIHALWYTTEERRKPSVPDARRRWNSAHERA